MTFDREGFSAFYQGSPNALASYRSYLNKVDRQTKGIDQVISADGPNAILQWAIDNPDLLQPSPRSTVSAIRKYLAFKAGAVSQSVDVDEEVDELQQVEATLFQYERELQAAVRRQLGAIENGLIAIDGSIEASHATGRSDILARDADGIAVVIELKRGVCPAGAIEQVLGYASDILAAGEARVRAILIAGSFSSRQIGAASRVPDLELRRYDLALRFENAL